MQEELAKLDLPTPPAVTPASQLPETVPLSNSTPRSSQTPGVAIISEPPNPRFGNYELLGELARGGMGVVYRARDLNLGRTVALKMLRFGFLAADDDVQRLHREAQIVANLNHPNIIPIFEVDEFDGQHYFAMALAAGGSLAEQIAKFSHDPKAAVTLLEKIARAVGYAHGKGVLHRDLKPSNILLDERGEPLVSDFGIAKLLDSDVQLTQPGAVIGTPAYMAPEQATSKLHEIGPATDVWALGVMLYELLLVQRPFKAATKEELRQQIIESEPPPPRLAQRRIDRDLETILYKCLEKDPRRRYADALALAEDLTRWNRGEPILARRRSWPARSWLAVRRHPWSSLAAGLFVTTLIATPLAVRALDPRAGLQPVVVRLDAGQPVQLLQPTGVPVWHRWAYGATTATLSATNDGNLRLNAWNTGLLELLPDPGSEHYRLETEIRHVDSARGRVGLYFGYAMTGADGARNHYLCQLAFSDLDLLEPQPPGKQGINAVRLKVRRLLEPGKPGGSHEIHTPISTVFAAAIAQPGGPVRQWRKLAAEIAPDGVAVFWEGKQINTIPWSELQRYAQKIAQTSRLGADAVELQPRSPLGLFIEDGAAEFRNVLVTPLSESTP